MSVQSGLDWDDIRVFLTVAEQGSVRAASLKLEVSHSTVARRIDVFEASLGTRLFDRTSAGYAITPTGERLHEYASNMEAQALKIERYIAGQDQRLEGAVSLTMPLSMANHLLIADLVEFTRSYPFIDLELVISDAILNISKREADLAVRFIPVGQSPPEHLVGMKLAVSYNAAYATESYLAANPVTGETLTARWLGWHEATAKPEWRLNTPFPDMPAQHRFNDPLLQLHAARHGAGIALIPCFLGDTDLALTRVPGCAPIPTFDVWLLSHPDLKNAARLTALRNTLAEAIKDKRALLDGSICT